MKLLTLALALPALLAAQALDPSSLTKPLGDSWPTYSGDYSGKRYSSLTQINQGNVKNLTLAWTSKVTPGMGAAGGRGFGPPGNAVIVGGEGGTADTGGGGFGGGTSIKRGYRT